MNRLFWPTIVLQSSFFVGCLGCHQTPPSNYNDNLRYERSLRSSEGKAYSDSVGEKTLNSSSGSGSYYRSDDKEYDNMRGFDPASEDDMDDNGMTRYMEVNDEEGWD